MNRSPDKILEALGKASRLRKKKTVKKFARVNAKTIDEVLPAPGVDNLRYCGRHKF
jgi:hypothetical protein